MLKRFSSILLLTLLVCFSFTSLKAGEVALEGAQIGEWTMDFSAAAKLAGEKDLPMLLNFTGSDWCGWCKLMDKNVFAKETFKTFAREEMVLVTLDFPRNSSIVPAKYVNRNHQLQSQFGVSGYPTYIILDSDGETVLGQLGAGRDKTPDVFIQELKNILRFRDSEIAEYAQTLAPAKAKAFKAAVASLKSTQNDFMAWLDTEPIRNPENEKIYSDFVTKLRANLTKINEFY